MIKELKEALPLPKKGARLGVPSQRVISIPEAVECVEKLAEAMGPALAPHISGLASHLFSLGLSHPLLSALKAISKHVPSEVALLQRHVLDAVTASLARCSFDEWAALPDAERSAAFGAVMTDSGSGSTGGSSGGGGVGKDVKDSVEASASHAVELAVHTLGLFNSFEWRTTPTVLRLVLEMAAHFLSAESVDVRRAATTACMTLLHGAADPDEMASHAAADAADRKSMDAERRTSSGGTAAAPNAVAAVQWADGAASGGDGGGGLSSSARAGTDGSSARERIAERAALGRVQVDVLRQALLTGVIDSDAWIRRRVFDSLGAAFDQQLGEPDALRAILLALDDDGFEIRLAAARVLGRVAHVAPSAALPPLREKLMQLTSELAAPPTRAGGQLPMVHAPRSFQTEQSLRLIAAIADKAGRLIAPYASAVLSAITPCLAEDSSTTTAAALNTLSALARAAPEAVRPHAAQLMPIAIEALRRQVAALRCAALSAISQLVRATADAGAPYAAYPSLLPTLLEMLHVDQTNEDLRIELLRALGTLGALDPATHTQQMLRLQRDRARAVRKPMSDAPAAGGLGGGSSVGRPPSNGKWRGNDKRLPVAAAATGAHGVSKPVVAAAAAASAAPTRAPIAQLEVVSAKSTEPEYYHAVAIQALLMMLDDRLQHKLHHDAAVALATITHSLGPGRIGRFLPSVIPALIRVTGALPSAKRGDHIRQLSEIVALCKPLAPEAAYSSRGAGGRAPSPPPGASEAAQHIRAQVPALLGLLERAWAVEDASTAEGRAEIQGRCLVLMESLHAAVGDVHFAYYLAEILPRVLALLTSDTTARRAGALGALRALDAFRGVLGAHLHAIMPQLLAVVDEGAAALCTDALRLIERLVAEHDVRPLAEPIVHALARALDTPFRTEALRVLCTLGERLGPLFLVFEPLVRPALKRALRETPRGTTEHRHFEDLVSFYLNAEGGAHEGLASFDAAAAAAVAADGAHAASLHPLASTSPRLAATGGHDSPSRLSVTEGEGRRPFTGANRERLARAWDIQQRVTASDWRDWMRTFSLTLLKESPSTALFHCSALAEGSVQLRVALFNAAYVSCWDELCAEEATEEPRGTAHRDGGASELVLNLQKAMESEQMPSDLIQRLLNLAEYMERHETTLHGARRTPLGIAWSKLGEVAQRCSAYAKALHYKELELEVSLPSKELVEGLISINFTIGQPAAAKGILDAHTRSDIPPADSVSPPVAEAAAPTTPAALAGPPTPSRPADDLAITLKLSDSPLWYERLHEYKAALDGYVALETSRPNDVTAKLGQMRCLHALGEWSAVADLSSSVWAEQLATGAGGMAEQGTEVATLGAAAAFNLAVHAAQPELAAPRWLEMRRYVDSMRPGMPDTSGYRAVLALHDGDLVGTQGCIDEARRGLYEEIAALLSESYSRAYVKIVQLQWLSELEEVLLHRASPQALPQAHLVALWTSRLKRATLAVEVRHRPRACAGCPSLDVCVRRPLLTRSLFHDRSARPPLRRAGMAAASRRARARRPARHAPRGAPALCSALPKVAPPHHRRASADPLWRARRWPPPARRPPLVVRPPFHSCHRRRLGRRRRAPPVALWIIGAARLLQVEIVNRLFSGRVARW